MAKKVKKKEVCEDCVKTRFFSNLERNRELTANAIRVFRLACSPLQLGESSLIVHVPNPSKKYRIKFCDCGNSFRIVCKGLK